MALGTFMLLSLRQLRLLLRVTQLAGIQRQLYVTPKAFYFQSVPPKVSHLCLFSTVPFKTLSYLLLYLIFTNAFIESSAPERGAEDTER